jgi:general secretion pathway protein A
MYQSFGLREEPFGVTPDPRFLYLSVSHREALSSLLHGIQSGCGFMALIAEPGMGKTTLLSEVLEQNRGTAETINLFQTQCTRQELIRYVLRDLNIETDANDLVAMHEKFNEILIKNHRAGRKVIMVLDEAQNLNEETLESIRLLSDFETARAKLVQIILAGQPQLGLKISRRGSSQLRQRISIISTLKPLSCSEVQEYIATRLWVAGRNAPLFTPSAVEAVWRYSGGIPRVINTYGFNLLSLAFALRKAMIDVSMVDEVSADLDIENTFKVDADQSTIASQSKRRLETPLAAPQSANTDGSPIYSTVRAQAASALLIDQSATGMKPVAALRSTPGGQEHSSEHSVSPGEHEAHSSRFRPRPVADNGSLLGPKKTRRRKVFASMAAAGLSTIALLLIASQSDRIGSIAAKSALLINPTVESGPDAAPPSDEGQPGVSNSPLTPRRATVSRRTGAVAGTTPSRPPLAPARIPGQRSRETEVPSSPTTLPSHLVQVPAPAVLGDAIKSLQPTTVDNLNSASGASNTGVLVPGRVIKRVVPEYPPLARSMRVEGTVELVARINSEGVVEDVVVKEGPDVLTAAAVAAVKQWRYSPYTRGGVPVVAEAPITIRFRR